MPNGEGKTNDMGCYRTGEIKVSRVLRFPFFSSLISS